MIGVAVVHSIANNNLWLILANVFYDNPFVGFIIFEKPIGHFCVLAHIHTKYFCCGI
mgnify:CR=1 FL=1